MITLNKKQLNELDKAPGVYVMKRAKYEYGIWLGIQLQKLGHKECVYNTRRIDKALLKSFEDKLQALGKVIVKAEKIEYFFLHDRKAVEKLTGN